MGGWGVLRSRRSKSGVLEREASERYEGFVVRNRLKRVSREAVRCNAFMREEELRRIPGRYIECVKSTDGRELRSNCEMREAFRTHFRDRFARCPDLQVQEFRNYLAERRNLFIYLYLFIYLERRKRLVTRVWLLNMKPVMR